MTISVHMTQIAFKGFRGGGLSRRDKRLVLRMREELNTPVRRLAEMLDVGQATIVRAYAPVLPSERDETLTEIGRAVGMGRCSALKLERRAMDHALRSAVILVAMRSDAQWDDEVLSDVSLALRVSREAMAGLLAVGDEGVVIDSAKVDELCEDVLRFQVAMGERL